MEKSNEEVMLELLNEPGVREKIIQFGTGDSVPREQAEASLARLLELARSDGGVTLAFMPPVVALLLAVVGPVASLGMRETVRVFEEDVERYEQKEAA